MFHIEKNHNTLAIFVLDFSELIPSSLIAGYPLAIFYRKVIFPLPKFHNHIYFIVSGLALCLFNFGSGVIHSLISIVATYLMVTFLPHGRPLRAASFTFHMVHILAGEL